MIVDHDLIPQSPATAPCFLSFTQTTPLCPTWGLTAVLFVWAVRAVVQTVAVFAGWDAGAVRAAEPVAFLLWRVVQGAAEWGDRQTFTSPRCRYLYLHVCLPMEGYHNTHILWPRNVIYPHEGKTTEEQAYARSTVCNRLKTTYVSIRRGLWNKLLYTGTRDCYKETEEALGKNMS